jgi:hypothetical protein
MGQQRPEVFMRTLVWGSVALAVLGVATLGAWCDEEMEIPLSRVPQKVLAAVKAKYPGADLRSATRGVEDKEVYYSIVLKHKTEEYEVSLTPEGEITEVARTIAPKDLPRTVSEALEKKYPQATIQETAEVREPGAKGKLTYYVEITTAEKKKLEVTLDPRGEIVKEKPLKEKK